MSSILLVTSSPRAESQSARIAKELADRISAQKPGSTIVHRDLETTSLPHIDRHFSAAIAKPAEARTAEEAQAINTSDALIDELLAADTVILATGLINFNISSLLKAWIDNVVRAGRTFKYGDTGPVGLAGNKKVYIVLASGGVYSQGPAASMNHAVPYLKSILGFIGITDVETLYVEGLSMGPEAAAKAIDAAQSRVRELAVAA